MKVKTTTGFECEIDTDALNDMEVLDLGVRIDEGDALAYSPFLTKILGKDNKARLYDLVRENGRVPIEKVAAEVGEILEQAGGKK
jgi:hypothetical protein